MIQYFIKVYKYQAIEMINFVNGRIMKLDRNIKYQFRKLKILSLFD